MKFNQIRYIQEYNKEHYRTFKVNLKKEELDELDELLKKERISKAQFLRDAIDNFRGNLEVKKSKLTKIDIH